MSLWSVVILLLIALQGDRRYVVRERATVTLMVVAAFFDIGPFIRAALHHPDLEIACRSDRVFEIVRHRKTLNLLGR